MSIDKAYIKYLVKNATGSNTVDKNKKTDHIEDEISKGKYILASKRYDARQSAANKAKGRRVYSRIIHTLIGAIAGGAVGSGKGIATELKTMRQPEFSVFNIEDSVKDYGRAIGSAFSNGAVSKRDVIPAALIGGALGYGTSLLKDRVLGIDPGNRV
jgi:hypothetical protein